jgi:hypothetical protein
MNLPYPPVNGREKTILRVLTSAFFLGRFLKPEGMQSNNRI